jgi:hypothetical protein
MILSSQEPQGQPWADHEARRARHFGLRAVARTLGLRDFVELRHPRAIHSKRAALHLVINRVNQEDA